MKITTKREDQPSTYRVFMDGHATGSSMGLAQKLDLMPPLRECWRLDGSGLVFDTREKAEKHASCLWINGASAGFAITKYREVRDDQA